MGKKVRFPRKSGIALGFIYVNGSYVATPALREQYAEKGTGDMALEYRSRRGTKYARDLMYTKQFSDAAVEWFKANFKFAETKPSTIGIIPRRDDSKFVLMADVMGNV